MVENQRTKRDQDRCRRSHLFTVRLWSEAMGDGRAEWRGQVRYVPSGETCYFRDWSTLVALFLDMVSGDGDGESDGVGVIPSSAQTPAAAKFSVLSVSER